MTWPAVQQKRFGNSLGFRMAPIGATASSHSHTDKSDTGHGHTDVDATTINVTANNTADETIFPVFVDGATGSQGLESDTAYTYNPNTGLLTAAGYAGAWQGGTIAVAKGGTGTTSLSNLITMGSHTTGDFVGTVTAGTGLTSTGGTTGEDVDHSLSVDASQTQVTSVGALDAGTITSNFGNINNGASTIDTAEVRATIVEIDTATTSGNVPTSDYGVFRYSVDGGYWYDTGTGGADTLAFLSGQGNATPERENAESTFWVMQSESDGSSGSRLLFEPIIPYGATDNTKNQAMIGWHNQLVQVYSYYQNAGYGGASAPGFRFIGDSNTGMYRHASDQIGFTVGGTATLAVSSSVVWPIPTSGTVELGISTRRWQKVWTVDVDTTNAVNVSSDSRLKENIQPAKLGLDFINDLNPVTYKMKEKKEDKIDATHHGIIAQEVIETLKDYGIDSLEDFGGITYDEEDEGESYYGARYTEFVPILMKAVQELSAEIKELKEKVYA